MLTRSTYAFVALAAWCLFVGLGCQQTNLLIPPPQLENELAQAKLGLPASAPTVKDSAAAEERVAEKPFVSSSSVAKPDLPKRSVSLSECLALALENGRIGTLFDGAGNSTRTSVTSLTESRSPSSVSDSIRVFAIDPSIGATAIEESLSRFDVWSKTGVFWNRTDQGNRFLTPLDPFQELTNRNKLDNVDFSTGLYRRLPSGGFAGLAFLNNYQDNVLTSSGAQVLNPAQRPRVDFLFEQPLWQGAGVFINQVRDTHPGSLREIYPDAGKAPGILLVRITQRQQQLEFERQVHELVYRVEEAYWQLYAAYWDLYSSENGMKQAHAAWQIAKARFDANGLSIEDLAMIEEQYHYFRNQRLQALGRGLPGRPGVLEAERRLRYIVGLPPEDGNRLTPHDSPDYLHFDPDLQLAAADALAHRPELKQVEQEIQAAELNILKAKDRLKPDVRFLGRYGLNGLGDDLGDGVRNLTNNPRHDWELGLRADFPIGFRGGHAERERAQLQLAQRLEFLKDQREKLLFSLQRSYQELVQNREQYKVRIKQREAAAMQLKARHEKFKAGGDPKQPGSFIDLLLRAQRNWADSLREEYVALCNYRTSIIDFERQKGTILQYANISFDGNTCRSSVQVQASKHIRRWHLQSRKVAAEPGVEGDVLPPIVDRAFPVAKRFSPGTTTVRPSLVGPSPPPNVPLLSIQPSFGRPTAIYAN